MTLRSDLMHASVYQLLRKEGVSRLGCVREQVAEWVMAIRFWYLKRQIRKFVRSKEKEFDRFKHEHEE